MAKVLISGLGTGPSGQNDVMLSERKYSQATYHIEDKEYPKQQFMAKALVKHFGIDKLYLVGTCRSMWERVYYEFAGDARDDEYWIGLDDKISSSDYKQSCIIEADLAQLNAVLDAHLGAHGSKCWLIKYGLNQAEILENFDLFLAIADQIQDGDEVYLDITHSFRSLALFEFVMVNFIENLAEREIKVAGVFYGNLDVVREVGYAPVIDLLPLFTINNWIKAIHELQVYGNGYIASELLQKENIHISRKLSKISDLININYLQGIRNEAKQIGRKSLAKLSGPARVVRGYLSKNIEQFTASEADSAFQLRMAKWFFARKRYVNGYIVLSEALITFACEMQGVNPSKEHCDSVKRYIRNNQSKNKNLKQLNSLIEEINKVRINTAHVLARRAEDEVAHDIKQAIPLCQRAEVLFNTLCETDFQ